MINKSAQKKQNNNNSLLSQNKTHLHVLLNS